MRSSFKARWGRIKGADKNKKYPEQKGSVLGRLGDYTVIYPFGMSCDLPDDALYIEIAPGVAIPVTVTRPDGTRGNIHIFHRDNLEGGVVIDPGKIALGTGNDAAAIGRVGDEVEIEVNQMTAQEVVTSVTGGSGSPAVGVYDPVTLTGTITTGGVNLSL